MSGVEHPILLALDAVAAVCLLSFHVWFALRQGGRVR